MRKGTYLCKYNIMPHDNYTLKHYLPPHGNYLLLIISPSSAWQLFIINYFPLLRMAIIHY